MTFTAACIQLNTQDNLAQNLEVAIALIREARKQGADFITLPENAFFMEENGAKLYEHSTSFEDHPALTAMQVLVRELGCWLLIGSLAVRMPNETKLANRSVLLAADGTIVAWYDKIHLFDVEVENDRRYDESSRFIYGEKSMIAPLPWGVLGMSICYDLRFPYLYRHLAKQGAQFLTVPSAFTHTTGTAHWHVLLRARAIENSAYVIAPAQCGTHPGNRRTYGHSLIVDPWGKVLAEGSETETGIILATIDSARVEQVRKQLPSLYHDREFSQ